MLVGLSRHHASPRGLMENVVVVVNQFHGHSSVGHVEVAVPIACNHNIFAGADGPRRGVSALVAYDGVGIEGQGLSSPIDRLPSSQINVGSSAVVQFKPFAIWPSAIVGSVRVWDDFIDANIAGARC